MKQEYSNKRLLSLLKPFVKDMIFISICLFFSTVINLFIPIVNQKLMDEGLISRNYRRIVLFSCLLLFFCCLNFLLKLYKEKKRINIESKLRNKLFYDAFFHLIKMNMEYFDKKNSDEIFTNINNDIEKIIMISRDELFFAMSQIFNILGGLIGLSLIEYRLMIWVIIFIPVKFLAVKVIAKRRETYFDKYIKEMENNAKFWGDSISGVCEIKIFGIMDFKIKELRGILVRMNGCIKEINYMNEINMEIDDVILQSVMFLVYIFGGILIINDQMTVGVIFAFITYATYILAPISAVLNIAYLLSGIEPSARRYFNFMDLEEENDVINNKNIVFNKDIIFRSVKFRYGSNEIFKDLNFTIPYKKKIAIIGENGVGKTTLLNLILRLREPIDGQILLGDQPISSFSIEQYRLLFGVVTQKIYLFNDSIYNNLCMYKKVDQDILDQLVEAVGLQDFIDQVSLEYVVGAEGTMLSGGQRQKIALVRALINDSPFIIFDEVTSNIDTLTTQRLISLLSNELKDKTVILVTHDLNILRYVDSIIILKNGKIDEIGTFQYLERHNHLVNKSIQ